MIFTTNIFVRLPSPTPPGEYDAEIEVNNVAIAATVIVSEVIELKIVPARLVLENRAGDPAIKRVAIRNSGNVPLTLGEIGPVVLDDELLDCRTLRGALQELTNEDVSIEEVLGSVARHASAALEQAGMLRVHNKCGTQTVYPGQTKTLNLEIRLPDHLDRHSRYFGDAVIYTEDLSFQIVPGRCVQPSAS